MRKALGICVVAMAMLPALGAGATEGETTQETYKDYFDSVSYSGNNGSLAWSGPWVEENESDGPNSGAIRVVSSGCSGKCLEIRGGLLLSEVRIRRAADLSGFLDAKLHFSLDIETLPVSTGVLYVEVKDGSDWPVLDQYPLQFTDKGNYSVSIPSSYLDDGFEFRFCLGELIGGDLVYIDDVKIIGSVAATPTTTTSTTSTTSTSTTSTTAPAVTTTTRPKVTTSSTAPDTSSTTGGTDGEPATVEPSTTTTTRPTSPATTDDDDDVIVGGPGDTVTGQPGSNGSATGSPPEGSGLRQSRVGLLADYRPATMGGMGAEDIEVLGVSLRADFSLAAEAFEATRLWIAGLALLIAIVLVSGMDMRRARRIEPTLVDLSESNPDRGESGTEA